MTAAASPSGGAEDGAQAVTAEAHPSGSTGDDDTVFAAGGVVWRAGSEGDDGRDLEVLVIHRPRYDDWTLPEGQDRARRRRSDGHGAARGVGGDRPALPPRARTWARSATSAKGRPKVVHYWSMQVDEDGTFAANSEVDEIEWMTSEAARDRLVYPHDVEVVDRFLATWV